MNTTKIATSEKLTKIRKWLTQNDLDAFIKTYDFESIISIMRKRIDGFNHDKKVIDNFFT